MPGDSLTIRKKLEAFTILLIAALLCIEIGTLWRSLFAPIWHMNNTAVSMIGKSEAELVQALGPPQHVVRASDLQGRTVDYPWRGMNFVPVPTRPVQSRVLLYSKWNYAIYVYIDAQGMVEYVARAAT